MVPFKPISSLIKTAKTNLIYASHFQVTPPTPPIIKFYKSLEKVYFMPDVKRFNMFILNKKMENTIHERTLQNVPFASLAFSIKLILNSII